MPRHDRPADLSLNLKTDQNARTIPSDKSSPINVDLSSFGGEVGSESTATLTALPQSPPTSPRFQKDGSRTFLRNFKNRLSPEQGQRGPTRQTAEEGEQYNNAAPGNMSQIYHLRKNPGSTTSLSLVGSAESVPKPLDEVGNRTNTPPNNNAYPGDDNLRSMRKDHSRDTIPRKEVRGEHYLESLLGSSSQPSDHPPASAPPAPDWPGAEARMPWALKGKDARAKSSERAIASESEDNISESRVGIPDDDKGKGGFMAGSKNVMNKARTGGGNLLGRFKIGRSGSHGGEHDEEEKQAKKEAKKEAKREKERLRELHKNKERDAAVPDSEYVFKVIHLPLVEQVRITRISKDLSSCRDKTEYWMPSLPWRAIDFLNLNCENEGLYRVPGSAPEIKRWQRRFDTELDVDLLDEQDLYDPNLIASMLKAWVRDLPNEILPYDLQNALAKSMAEDNPEYQKPGQTAPQKLRDALSELPPFNYYLLFALTCHLSLLLSHQSKNKMDLHNLYICVGQSIKLDRWLFHYLVGDWRHCWQGCFTEKEYLDRENAYEQGLAQVQMNGEDVLSINSSTQNLAPEERTISSSGSHDGRTLEVYRPGGSSHGTPNRASPMVYDSRRPGERRDQRGYSDRSQNYFR